MQIKFLVLELIKKLLGSGKKDALDSLDKLTEAAGELGYTSEQIEEALDSFHGFPLDDDDLGMVAGGVGDTLQVGVAGSWGNGQVDVMDAGKPNIIGFNADLSLTNMTNCLPDGIDVNNNQAFGINQSSQGVNNSGAFGISRL